MKKIMKKITSVFLATAMFLSMVLVVPPVKAAGNPELLFPANSITSSKVGEIDVQGENGTYNGKIAVKIPLVKMLEPMENEMESLGKTGAYPHGREGKNKIAYVRFYVEFPDGYLNTKVDVNLDDINIENGLSFIDKNSFKKEVDGNRLYFRVSLNDVNWQSIYNLYAHDKELGGEQTFDINIPYTVKAANDKDAVKFDSEKIKAYGDFAFYPGGFQAVLGFGLKEFKTDEVEVPLTEGYAKAYGVEEPGSGTEEPGSGTENLGVKYDESNITINKDDGKFDFSFTFNFNDLKNKKPAESKVANALLDLFVVNASAAEPEASAEEKNEIKVYLKVSPGIDMNNAKYSVINGTFKNAEIIDNAGTKDREVVVTLEVKDKSKPVTINVGDVSLVKMNASDSLISELYPVLSENTISVDKITENGKEFDIDKKTNTLTVNTSLLLGGDLGVLDNGKFNSEEKEVYRYPENSKNGMSIVGTLDVTKVKNQIKFVTLAQMDPGKLSTATKDDLDGFKLDPEKVKDITVKDIDTEFTAAINIENNLKEYEIKKLQKIDKNNIKLVEFKNNEVTDKAVENYKIENVEVSDKGKITVSMKFTPKEEQPMAYKDFYKNIVDIMPDKMAVIINGVKLKKDATEKTLYKIEGTMDGRFKAVAIKSSLEIPFKFNWAAIQEQGGRDSALDPSTDNTTIRFSFYKGKEPKPSGSSSSSHHSSSSSSKPVCNCPIKKVYGKDRIETSIRIAEKYYGRANTVILAMKDQFPDSLTATVLSKQLNAPILLTETEKLNESVAAEIQRLGATHVIIVGGPRSVSENVKKEVKERFDQNVERISGIDRYGTSEMVARRVVGLTGKLNKAVVASGEVFPDALSVSPYAASKGYPILLVRKNQVPVQINNAVKDLEIKDTYLIGGNNTISANTQKNLPKVVERMYGPTRYATAIAIAKAKFADSDQAFLTSGEVFSDALVIGPVAGKYQAPVLLTPHNTLDSLTNYIDGSKIKTITAVGGPRYLPASIFYLLDK